MANKLNLNQQKPLIKHLLYFLSLGLLIIIMQYLDRSGLLLFLYFLLMPAGIIAVFIITRYFYKSLGQIKSILLSFIASAIAVALVLYDYHAPRKWFQNFCEINNAGLHVYKTVQNVPSYFAATNRVGCDATCIDGLLHSEFQFVEAEFKEDEFKKYLQLFNTGTGTPNIKESYQYMTFATEPGYYKFYLINSEDDPKCQIFNKWLSLSQKKRLDAGYGRDERYKGKCIASEKIDHITSKYSIIYNTSTRDIQGRINHGQTKIFETNNNEIVAERNRFYFKPRMFFYAHQALSDLTCPEKPLDWKYDEILIPPKKEL